MKCQTFLLAGLVWMAGGLWAQEAPAPKAGGMPPKLENGRRGGRPFHQPMDFRGEDMLLLMNKLKTEKPEEYARLQELRKTDRSQFFKELRQHMPKRNNGNGELWKSERECRELVKKIKA
ncbi:MAG: hypothetical protein IJJ26_12635, partial [Victivallales bacterium]|nr:hypothetical protein [Victivallales bacterium]